VTRRFSDFLGLHEKLVGRYQTQGIVIPPPPEKSVVGMQQCDFRFDLFFSFSFRNIF